jgi:hypothetical protein
MRRLSGAGLGVLFDVQNSLGASLDTDPAGNTFTGTGFALCLDHYLEGAGLDTLATVDAKLLVDHVHALVVLGDGAGFAGFGAFATLRAGANLELLRIVGPHNVDARQILLLVVFAFVERLGTDALTGQAKHTILQILNS